MKGTEYQYTGLHIGTIISTLRISIGDFAAIDTSASLSDTADNYMFWICWIFIMAATAIVFLNFIVAEASASYAKVMDEISENVWKEAAELISEAESLDPYNRNLKKYPRYIITRNIDVWGNRFKR